MPGHDYAAGGIYFVTICTFDRVCLFGDVVNAEMRLSPLGECVLETWRAIPRHNIGVETDAAVVMPNHVHGVLRIASVGATHASPGSVGPDGFDTAKRLSGGPAPRSLGSIVGSFKSAAARRINRSRSTPGADVWQRGFHEHLIRKDDVMDRIRNYIAANPANWMSDPEHPHRSSDGPEAAESWCV